MERVTSVKKVTSDPVALMQATRASMVANNPDFENRIPEVTRDNLRDFGAAIVNYEPAANEFIKTLPNIIGKQIINYNMFTNKLRVLKKGRLEFGDTVEMVYVPVARAHQFNPAVAETQWMKREIPSAVTAFAKLNYRVFYKATISDDMLRNAFMSWTGVSDFINGVFASLYNGAELDEFTIMKQQLAAYGTAGGFGVAVIPTVTDSDSAHAALAVIRAVSNKMEFFRTDMNSIGVETLTPKNKQVLLVDAETDAYLSVMGYATLFNLEPARAQYRVIVLDEIPIEGVHAILMDEDFYAVWDALESFRRDVNGEGLYWNYWAHFWRIVSVMPWANAVAFVTTKPTVTKITLTAPTTAVPKGSTATITKTVTGTGLYPQGVVYSLTGGKSSATMISPFGTVYVGADETATSLTVTAVSTYDSTVTGTATVTLA